MSKKIAFIVLVAGSLLFVQCKREPINIEPNISTLSDYESEDGAISIHIKGGKSPYTIEWSTGSNDTIISQLKAGPYYVTIVDARNKQFIDTIEVTQPPYPVCIDADNNSYKTAIIGKQVWMLENLKTSIAANGERIDHYADTSMADTEFLYTWKAAMADSTTESTQGICPDGWHLPSDKEWFELTDFIKQEGVEFTEIFEPQYAGFYNNGFNNQGKSVSYWTSTSAKDNAWKRFVHADLSKTFRYHEKKENAISVRCVRN